MKMPTLAGLGLLMMASALPQAHAATYGDGMPSAQKVRFCERVRDFAVQAFYDREKNVMCLKAKFKLMMLISGANALAARLGEVPRTRCPL